jgi:formylglycine-generating enzyme
MGANTKLNYIQGRTNEMKITIAVISLFLLSCMQIFSQNTDGFAAAFSASSTLADDKIPGRYGADKAFDGNPLTSWVEGTDDEGVGEYIKLSFSQEITVDAIEVMPGYFDDRFWIRNNRIKRLEVRTEKNSFTLGFQDEMKAQISHLDGTMTFTEIVFRIVDTYKGSSWDDTCIAEIAFFLAGEKISLHQYCPDGFVFVSGGSFQMGSDSLTTNEKPAHSVTLGSFLISKYEVTQGEYMEIMGTNPSWDTEGSDNTYPVNNVDWYNAVKFCNALSIKHGLPQAYFVNENEFDPNNQNHVANAKWWLVTWDKSAHGYRLPTEAEWEYAAGGGSDGIDYLYSGSDEIDDVAWCKPNSSGNLHPVGKKQPNELGIFDMSGNVREWCWDWLGQYPSNDQTDPVGVPSGSIRIARGGNFYHSTETARISSRGYATPNESGGSIQGIRVVLTVAD